MADETPLWLNLKWGMKASCKNMDDKDRRVVQLEAEIKNLKISKEELQRQIRELSRALVNVGMIVNKHKPL